MINLLQHGLYHWIPRPLDFHIVYIIIKRYSGRENQSHYYVSTPKRSLINSCL